MVLCRSRVARVSMHDRIVALYGHPHILRKSALSIRGGAGVFEKVLSGKGYRTALEIGTYRGVSAAAMSEFVEKVITIDLRFGKLEYNRVHQVDPRDAEHDRHAFWRALGVDNIEFIQVEDDAEKKTVIEALDFDFVFIDGAHDATVRNDFELVKRCGRVLFHDADDNRKRATKPGASNHVFEFVTTLPPEQMTFLDIFALWEA